MEKIKILFYSHTIDYAGTWRSHERILLNLDKDCFDVYVFYNPNQNNNRLEYLMSKMDNNKIIPFIASKEKLGPTEGYPYVSTNFDEIVKKYDFDIIHFARSGYFEWPFNKRLCPIQIETNIFGGRDESEFLDYSVAICQTIANLRGRYDKVIYNPIPSSEKEKTNNLKNKLSLKEDEIVFGRIGRPDNFDSISFDALHILKNLGYKFKYIIIGACNNAINKINELQLNNECIVLETTSDDDFIHKFHNTIDVFLHYRSDGECHSTAIAQAMSYGIPIVSHYAGFNGQSETINDGGFVANDKNSYCDYIVKLISDKNFYNKISDNSKKQSQKFNQDFIVKEWENVYKELINKKIKK
jgi:hypothetical protein